MARTKTEQEGTALYQGGAVECACGTTFTPEVYERAEGAGILMAFDCPDCRKRFTVAHINKRGLEIRAQLAAIGRQSPKASMSVINERVRTIRRLKQELKRHVTR